jgi:hypothetical protein
VRDFWVSLWFKQRGGCGRGKVSGTFGGWGHRDERRTTCARAD